MKTDTIFVSISSYRDDVCHDTLLSIYKNAQKPENVYVGICQQNKEGDKDCIGDIDDKYKPNIRITRIPNT